jgi:hypothetical protein
MRIFSAKVAKIEKVANEAKLGVFQESYRASRLNGVK